MRVTGVARLVLIGLAGLALRPSPSNAQDGGIAYRPKAGAHADAGPRAIEQNLPPGSKVVRIPIEGPIELGVAAFVRRSLDQHGDAKLIVLDINTLGGRLDAAIQIRDALLGSKVPTVAFINPRAISAGALISLACDVIAISRGGSIGAATPISSSGEAMTEAVEEKMVSYMRTEMRTTAEAKGRRGDVAEAMVDRSVVIKDVVQAGKLLTLDTAEALRVGIADRQVDNLEKLLQVLGVSAPQLVHEKETWAEVVARFLTSPVVAGLLMSLGMLGLMIELYSPGLGLPGAVGLVCLLAFFFGHAVARLAGLEEMVMVVLGLGLLVLEIFVTPGFGVAGITGLGLILAGFVMALIGLPLDVSFASGQFGDAVERVSLAMLLTLVLSVVAVRYIPRTQAGRRLVLQTATAADLGFVAAEQDDELEGRSGIALTDLRPAGIADLQGRRVDVVSVGDYIDKGEPVRVVEITGNRVVVQKDVESSDVEPDTEV